MALTIPSIQMADEEPVLPRLREDLSLYPAAPAIDGSPAWHLGDPAANKFYQLGWAAFEILTRWELGRASAIVAAVNRDTTLDIESEEVEQVLLFLRQHNLLEARTAADSAQLNAVVQARKMHWATWLVKNYLFFRVPLVRPMAFLDRFLHLTDIFWNRRFWMGLGAFALFSLYLVARQWDAFIHSFSGYQGWEMLLSFGVALSLAKVVHELGHAFAARHHGCKVPSIGVAFLVMWPVLYTDTNEVWKLPSKTARLQIGIAGIASELMLAVFATFLWVMLPEGGLRASVFFLATSSWVMTLALNISPFMRFDGYFLLADFLGMPNLHTRAFAFGRWWLREKLFDLGLPPPEVAPPSRVRVLIGFALATWVYRLVVFLSIAFLVYHAFFKLLGIVLLLVELGYFIVLPFAKEFQAWWQLRQQMHWNRASKRSAVLAAILVLGIILPWQFELTAPAVIAPEREQTLFAPAAARVESVAPRAASVKAGEVLAVLDSPDLDYRIAQARVAELDLRLRVQQQNFSADLLGQGSALQNHWQEAKANLDGLLEEQTRLQVKAPFDGVLLAANQDLAPGVWVAPREMLFDIGDRRSTAVEAFVGEDDLPRLHVGASARFVPDAPEFGRYNCTISRIDSFTVTELDEPALASVYGGRVAVRHDARGALVPVNSIYRVRMDQCAPALAPRLRVRGVVHLRADGQSGLLSGVRQLLRVLWREAGF
ncbi:HlyD family efflux transporter periplasmic adaptor subunit [Massilia sp. TS11]|uniref:HlyD family efflux transporter periplasmic adaptor subunit n=1 Tax=Massilia sp. TS11 TaxID=2908003 RepID=UPI001EDA021D|nr:HlyD family efflux transporter periplasmic adaptor subunit [Massilia sp. TS11]MCG2584461.1 HlyD family efflux transporter periplasmic adaptor subunit [Massilia sp. TS11]